MYTELYVPGIAVSTSCELSHFILTVTPHMRDCYYLHFTGDKTEGLEDLNLKYKKFDQNGMNSTVSQGENKAQDLTQEP